MRLLSTLTGELHEFFDENIPPYTILSHTWGDGEVSFQDLESSEKTNKAGYHKIKSCCELAASEGWRYVWIDTCCIDKRSSAELSEAINSMFRWYQRAEVCYAYLSDVDVTGKDSSSLTSIRGSRWFTRGWTLQELLAPAQVIFYDKNWTDIGTKRSLREEISSETGIQDEHLFDPMDACIAVKMSWASRRTTARREDIAYCLLGLFDLNMPLLYGEGEKAFFRLQYELLQSGLQSGGDDESIFAWEDGKSPLSGILAPSPAAFATSGNIERANTPYGHIPYGHYLVSNLTRKSLLATFFVLKDSSSRGSDLEPLVILRCKRRGENKTCLGIRITKPYQARYYVRSNHSRLITCRASLNLEAFDKFPQTKRSEEISLSSFLEEVHPSMFDSIGEKGTIGVRWPALQIDPRIARNCSKYLDFKIENPGCWTFRCTRHWTMIGMLFVSRDGERFLIIFVRTYFNNTIHSIDVNISNSISVQEAFDDWQESRRGLDTFFGVLQRGSQLTVKSRKNLIDNHICHMTHIDVIKNDSAFELKDVQVRSLSRGED